MNKKNIIFSFIFLCLLLTVFLIVNQFNNANAASAELKTAISPQPRYRLIWSDEFDGKSLDTSKWIKIPRLPHLWRMNMSPDERLYQFKDGYIRLLAMKNTWMPNDTAKVVTGGISTKGKFEVGYGKVEARIRLSDAMGCWPAFWLASFSYGMDDPRRAEIDLFERYNHDNFIHQAAHNHYIDSQKKQSKDVYSSTYKVNVNKWNVYGVEILPNKLVFSVNGKKTFVYDKIEDQNVVGQFPYGLTKCVIRLSMQWANPWLDKVRRIEELPAYMDVDWVRVYAL